MSWLDAWLPGGLRFEAPWAFLVVPLPWAVYAFAPPFRRAAEAVRVPFFARLSGLVSRENRHLGARARPIVERVGLALLWASLVTALARPVLHGAPVVTRKSARDLLLAVDLSGSMAATDLTAPGEPPRSRLDVVKAVVGDFVARRNGDRLGLLVFGAAPFVQVPFTTDTTVVRELLQETDVGMAGPPTALGDAVGLAIRVLRRSEAKSRVVVLLTDGNDTGSMVPPVQAARIAAREGVVLHIVGVGDPRAAGEEPLNDEVLRTMARLTGGDYTHAADAPALARFYQDLDGREPIVFEERTFVPTRTVFHWPLAAAAGLLGAAALTVTVQILLGELRRRRGAPSPDAPAVAPDPSDATSTPSQVRHA